MVLKRGYRENLLEKILITPNKLGNDVVLRLRQLHVCNSPSLSTTTRRRSRFPKPQTKINSIIDNDPDILKWNKLISSHMRNGHCDSALRVFDTMPRRSSVSYTAMISGYLRNGKFHLARDLFDKMPQRDLVSWNVMLTGYIRNQRLGDARKLFDLMPERDVVSWTAMLSGYCQNGGIDQARKFFDMMPQRNSVSWAAIIAGYAQNGHYEEALNMFVELKRDGESLNTATFICALSTCADIAALELGKQVHGQAVKTGYETCCFVGNALLEMYLKCGSIGEAYNVFEGIEAKHIVSWNVMLTGYVRNQRLGDARKLFGLMPERDVVSWTAMLSGYVQNGYVDEAREVFDSMPEKNSISWNGLLAAYVQNGRIEEGRQLFESKLDWDLISWNCLMGGFVNQKRLGDARKLFDRMPIRNEISWNTMISGYAKDGDLSEARKLFEESPIRNVFTWTSMVSGYVQNGMLDEARRFFDEMPEKDEVSYDSMIAGYVQCKKMDLARELFEAMPFRSICSWNTMITGYCQNGGIDQARKLFDMMPQRDSVSWAAIIAGYAQNSHYEEALNMFVELKRDGESLNTATFCCALSTCADIAALELGKQVHGQAVKTGYETGLFVGNALLGMYYKCGSISEAYNVFEGIEAKDIVSWNTMLAGYAWHGFEREALMVFESMKMAGLRPNENTMVGVLSACSHTGLTDRGTEYFYSMEKDYGVTPTSKHYTCMIDLLGRAGRFEEALQLMRNMPFEPDVVAWTALLGACQIHGNTELGEKAAEMVFKMEPHNPGTYVLLSNLYAASGRWVDVGKIRSKMKDVGVQNVPGYSWVEVQNKIHKSMVGDCFHPDKARIYAQVSQ